MNNKKLNILLLEDEPTDAELVQRALRQEGLEFTALRVDTEAAFRRALEEFAPDIVLCDYKLPQYNGRAALEYTRQVHPEIPVIIVTGSLGEEQAVELLKSGAKDYILKDRLSRLGKAVIRELSWEQGRRRRQETENALRESEEKFRSITDSAQDAILMMDHDGRITNWNQAAEKIFGYAKEEALGQDLHVLIVPQRYHAAYHQGFSHFLGSGEGAVIGKTLELEAVRKGGVEFPIGLSLSAVKLKDHWHAIGIVRDISERKQQEIKIHKLNALLLAIRQINEYLLVTRDEQELYAFICNTLVKLEHVTVVWIGHKMPDFSIIPVASAGEGDADLPGMQGRWDDSARGRGLAGTAIRENRPVVSDDAEQDPRLSPWQDYVRRWHVKSGAAVPLVADGNIIGVMVVLSSQLAAFDEESVKFMAEVAGDIALGVRTLRLGQDLATTLETLKKSLNSIVETIASIVEYRDPYTAGHERRVAQLASAIGREIGLPEQQIEGLRVAGYIHDLGKIAVPAEILSKPSVLNELERQLIMEHSRAGYELLQNLDFPWPVAQAVLQHHERLDGSGYPQKLKGDQIILEARILMVADVIEAIANYRPYRPARGLDAALDEVMRGRGTYYDPIIVDACVRLFKEGRFAFS